ncbi:MAG: TPM domain-containing protein [Candidatus Falkowbacteria bacterium]
MKNRIMIISLCLLALSIGQTEVFGRGGSFGGCRMSGSRMSGSRNSFGTRSGGIRSGSRNYSKIGAGGSRGIRSFSKASSPKSISKYIGRAFSKPKTISTSRYARRSVSYTYTRPVRFHNPYLNYYLLMSYHHNNYYHDSLRVDTNAFPGFGKGKSGGAGSSAFFTDSLQKHNKDSLEITDLQPINFLSDYAGIIPDRDEPKINYLIRHYKKITGAEIAVLTVPTLGDEIDLEDYAQVLFDKWGIGESGANNGILIIISSEDEILRIQPGYGLEGLLPDASCREIEDEIMIPLCEKKQWEPAITNSINSIIKKLGQEPVEIMKKELAKRQKIEEQEMKEAALIFFQVLAVIAFIILVVWLIVRAKMK